MPNIIPFPQSPQPFWLTQSFHCRYAVSTANKKAVGFDSLDSKRRTPPAERFFHVRGKSPMGGACRNPSGLPVSFCAGLSTCKLLPTLLTEGSKLSNLQKETDHA